MRPKTEKHSSEDLWYKSVWYKWILWYKYIFNIIYNMLIITRHIGFDKYLSSKIK